MTNLYWITESSVGIQFSFIGINFHQMRKMRCLWTVVVHLLTKAMVTSKQRKLMISKYEIQC